MVLRTFKGEVCFYKDRKTKVKEPCKRCNGTGKVLKKDD